MLYPIDEIKSLGLDQLSDRELEAAIDSLNGFSALFGKGWVNEFFHGGQSHCFVLALNQLWFQWNKVRELLGAEKILARWKSGPNEEGVISELFVISGLLDGNFEVELFPEYAGKVPDARFRHSTGDWIYLEVSKRGISEVLAWTHKCLQKLATAATVQVAKHGKVGLSRNPTETELERILGWLVTLKTESARFADLAVFHSDPFGPGEATQMTNQLCSPPNLICSQRMLSSRMA